MIISLIIHDSLVMYTGIYHDTCLYNTRTISELYIDYQRTIHDKTVIKP